MKKKITEKNIDDYLSQHLCYEDDIKAYHALNEEDRECILHGINREPIKIDLNGGFVAEIKYDFQWGKFGLDMTLFENNKWIWKHFYTFAPYNFKQFFVTCGYETKRQITNMFIESLCFNVDWVADTPNLKIVRKIILSKPDTAKTKK